MQHIKDTKKAGEFEKFIDSDSKTGLCLEDTLKFFETQRIFKQFESVKQGGINVVLVLTALLVMLFYNGRNIHNFLNPGKSLTPCAKQKKMQANKMLKGWKTMWHVPGKSSQNSGER